MGTKQAYKTYERGVRIQDTIISFGSGMSFTDAPLMEGFVKLLVNYDFGENGITLVPRKGMNTSSEGLFDYPDPQDALYYKETSNEDFLNGEGMAIVAGNRMTRGATEYYQIIVGLITGHQNNRYLGDAWVLTLAYTITQGQPHSYIYYTKLNDEFTKCYFNKPREGDSSIHNIPLNDSKYVKRHIGCFAFNGDYYYFCTDGNLYHTVFNTEQNKYNREIVNAYKPDQAETQNSMYNMLLDKPYSFVNRQFGGVLNLTGFMPYDSTGPIISPQVGIAYDYELFYTYPTANEKYYLHIKWINLDSDVVITLNRNEKKEYTVGEKWIIEGLSVNSSKDQTLNAQFIIYAVPVEKAKFSEDGTRLLEESLYEATIMHASFSYAPKDSSILNHKVKNYDLSHATGMAYWKNRLWVFGARDTETGDQDNNLLFASEVNRPDWFPYTSGADIFDEEIVCLQPMLDDLLVFTNHSLYGLALSADGLSWTKSQLQSNLHITQWDLNLIQIVKNMVFFKSGNYFYMVVPKLTAASGAGLAIAPVSKNITFFLDNFESNVNKIVDDLYNYSCYNIFGDSAKTKFNLKLIHYYNYLDYEDVHNTYVFECTKETKVSFIQGTSEYNTETQTVYLNLELLYNTVSRTWRTYILESQRVRQPLFMNATGKGKYAELVEFNNRACVQFLEYTNKEVKDRYIKQSSSEAVATEAFLIQNWQCLDTGSLDQNSDMKKRFREYQIKINKPYISTLKFYSNFLIDKNTRLCEYLYSYTELPDEVNDSYTNLVVEAQPYAGNYGPPTIRDTTPLSGADFSTTTLGTWKLGESKFPGITEYKVRVPVSGKGYLPRIVVMSYNTVPYEILSCATVYRQLYSR